MGSPVPWLRVVNTSRSVLLDMANDLRHEERETHFQKLKGCLGRSNTQDLLCRNGWEGLCCCWLVVPAMNNIKWLSIVLQRPSPEWEPEE